MIRDPPTIGGPVLDAPSLTATFMRGSAVF